MPTYCSMSPRTLATFTGILRRPVKLVPAEQQSGLPAHTAQRLNHKVTGGNIAEIADMNRTGRTDARGAHILILVGSTGDYLLCDILRPNQHKDHLIDRLNLNFQTATQNVPANIIPDHITISRILMSTLASRPVERSLITRRALVPPHFAARRAVPLTAHCCQTHIAARHAVPPAALCRSPRFAARRALPLAALCPPTALCCPPRIAAHCALPLTAHCPSDVHCKKRQNAERELRQIAHHALPPAAHCRSLRCAARRALPLTAMCRSPRFAAHCAVPPAALCRPPRFAAHCAVPLAALCRPLRQIRRSSMPAH